MLSLLSFKNAFKTVTKSLTTKKEEQSVGSFNWLGKKETKAQVPETLVEMKLQSKEPQPYFVFDSNTYAPKEIWAKESDAVPGLFFLKRKEGINWDTAYTGPSLFPTAEGAIIGEECLVLSAIEDYKRRMQKLCELRNKYRAL